MIRFLVRLMGFVLLASGAALVIVDGTRSIAANTFLPTTLGETLSTLFTARFAAWKGELAAALPDWAAEHALAYVLMVPTCVVLIVLAAGLLIAARPPAGSIGFAIER